MSFDLLAYLQRIHYHGLPTPTVDTLHALHRAHLLAIPYENLDIHLHRPLTLDLDTIVDKIVNRGRGGWCYEMNGLFACALRAIGFQVELLGSRVGSPAQGGDADLDHLILCVTLDQPYLVDVGFGNAFLEPLPMKEGSYQQGWLAYRLEREGEKWYFHNHPAGGAGYGFTLATRSLPGFAPRCHELQTSLDSGFVKNTVCHKFSGESITTLRGAVLKTVSAQGVNETVIGNPSDYSVTLRQQFGLQLEDAEVTTIWDGVWERHQAWVQSLSTAEQAS